MDPAVATWIVMAERSVVSRHTTVACFVWLLWDWVSTLDEEINFIWLKKRSFSKFLYFATRYFGLLLLSFEMLSETRGWNLEFCKSYYYIVGIATTILLYIVEIGMQFRVYALYDCSKKVLLVNGALFLTEVIAISTMLALDFRQRARPIATPDIDHLPLTGCWNMAKPHFTFATWIIGLAFELYLFTMVCYKAYGKYSQYGTFAGIFKLMFRDAVAWFIFIGALIGWNAFSWFGGSSGSVFLGLPFLHAGASIGGSRLLLNLGKAYYVTKGDSAVTLGVTGSMINVRHKHNHELQTIGGSVRTSATNSTTAFAHRPPPPMKELSRGRTLSPSWTPSYPSSIPPTEENALQIDLGFGHGSGYGGSSGGKPTHYTYTEVWIEHPNVMWRDIEFDIDGRTNGAARDWRLRSRSRSRRNSPSLD